MTPKVNDDPRSVGYEQTDEYRPRAPTNTLPDLGAPERCVRALWRRRARLAAASEPEAPPAAPPPMPVDWAAIAAAIRMEDAQRAERRALAETAP